MGIPMVLGVRTTEPLEEIPANTGFLIWDPNDSDP